MKKGDIKTGLNQVSYELVKRIGKGGQAEVWSVKSCSDGEMYAYKYYKHNTNGVRTNIEDLIKIGQFKDKNGNILDSVVLPITVVEENGDAFGYVMDLLDLKDYTNLKKAWQQEYPSCRALCRIVKNLATTFETFHLSYGMCYKDVNEGNVFFNPKTGDVKIIDNDNVGYSDKFTIKGTSGYMAPEVVLGGKPDHKSDRFSLAVYVYRLLIGGFPFEGPYTEEYCRSKDVLSDEARKVIFGTNPIFVWNPNDTCNCIDGLTDCQSVGQTKLWKLLPKEVKDLFIKTFVTNLPKARCAERATDQDWYDVFNDLEKTLVKCPHCGAETFISSTRCFSCGEILPQRKVINKNINELPNPVTNTVLKKKTEHTHKAVFKVLSAGEKNEIKSFAVASIIKGEDISKNLPSGPIFKVLYNKAVKKVGIRNLGTIPWKVSIKDAFGNKVSKEYGLGEILELQKGMHIRIINKVVHLKVEDII